MRNFILITALLALPVQAQVTFFSDSMGLPLGTANQVGNTTFYSDAKGLPLGTAQNTGNVTFFNDAMGLPLGTANTPQPFPTYNTPRISTPPAPLFPTSPTFPTSPRGM
jgi:hypothetical protein